MDVIARSWTISNVDGGPLTVRQSDRDVEPWLIVGESVEVVSADQLRGAVEDRDHFERALERIFHGSEDHAWEDARKALDTRPSRRGGQ